MGERWRAGRKVGRTVYIHGEGDEVGRLVGLMDTLELAERVCEAVNARAAVDQRQSAIVEGKPLDLTHHEDPAFIDVSAVEEWLDDDTGDLSAPYEDIRRLVDTYRDAIRGES